MLSKFLNRNPLLKYTLYSLKNRKKRSWLTILGIFIGIASVVALISLGQGLNQTVKEEFNKLGIDNLILTPGTGVLSMAQTSSYITEKDIESIKKVKGVNEVTYIKYIMSGLESNNEIKYAWVSGIELEPAKEEILKSMGFRKIWRGRDLKQGDKYKIVIGIAYNQDNLFSKPVNVGDKINIKGKDFKVVGILERIGSSQDDSSVYIPMKTYNELFKDKYIIMGIINLKKNEDRTYMKDKITEFLKKRKGIDKDDDTKFTIQTPEELMSSMNNILLIVNVVLIGIATISLVVGGIGIMNTMYTSVLERRKEIGIMKSIGAKNRDILKIFLIESGLLGLVGGIIGVILGLIICYSAEKIALIYLKTNLLQAYYSWYLITGSLLFSTLIGIISGVMPAINASKQNPIDALRYE